MFKNLQWFVGLNEREIVTALNAVLANEKALVLLVPSRSKLRLVPVESNTKWERRMSNTLEPLKVPVKGYIGIAGKEPWPNTKWLYEKEGLQKLLDPYIRESELFYVSNELALAAEAVAKIDTLISQGSSDIGETWVVINYLTDKNGTKLEVLTTATFFALDSFYTKKSKMATELAEWFVPIKNFGVVDPVLQPTILVSKKEVPKEIKTKRTRMDAVALLIHDYIAQCRRSGIKPDINGCHAFLASDLEIDTKPGGVLLWVTQTGETKELKKRNLSDRFNRAIKSG